MEGSGNNTTDHDLPRQSRNTVIVTDIVCCQCTLGLQSPGKCLDTFELSSANSMEHSPSWETANTQLVRKNPTSQRPRKCFKIYFNIIFHSITKLSAWFLSPSYFPARILSEFLCLPGELLSWPVSFSFDSITAIFGGRVQIMVSLFMKSSAVSC